MYDKVIQSAKSLVFYFLFILFCGNLAGCEGEQPVSLEQQVAGLWSYTGLITPSGEDLPLNGIFLFSNGVFVQYAQYKGEPARVQGSMAHAGPYSVVDDVIHLAAEQTISTAPSENPPLTYRGLTEHEVDVRRVNDELTLSFKRTGTAQIFELAGPGEGEVYKLEHGALAFVDGWFILVSGDEDGVDTGYGKYESENGAIRLDITYWTSADKSSASNTNHTSMDATFDGRHLTLEDGRRFQVLP